MMRIKFKTESFQRDIQRYLRATGRDLDSVVTQVARGVTRDLAKATPPKIADGVFGQTWGFQKKIGEAAVKRDFGRSHIGANELDLWNAGGRIRRSFRAAVKARDVKAVTAMLRADGNKKFVVILNASEKHHENQRSRATGHVPKGAVRAVVLNWASMKPLLKRLQQDVMKTKSGWKAAAQALRVALPKSITRHSAPGRYQDLGRPMQPWHKVSNLVDYAQRWTSDILPIVIRVNRGRLNRQLEKWLRAQRSKFKRA